MNFYRAPTSHIRSDLINGASSKSSTLDGGFTGVHVVHALVSPCIGRVYQVSEAFNNIAGNSITRILMQAASQMHRGLLESVDGYSQSLTKVSQATLF